MLCVITGDHDWLEAGKREYGEPQAAVCRGCGAITLLPTESPVELRLERTNG